MITMMRKKANISLEVLEAVVEAEVAQADLVDALAMEIAMVTAVTIMEAAQTLHLWLAVS